MLHCIWHPVCGEQVVQTDEFNKRLASGLWFKTQREAQTATLEDKSHGNSEQQRHHVQCATIKAGDDRRQTDGIGGLDANERDHGEHGNACADVRKSTHKRTRPRISGQVKRECIDVPSSENYQ